MIFNGNIISEETFRLEDDKLNRYGLYEYAMNLGSYLGVKYAFTEEPDGKPHETACFDPEDNLVMIPAWAIDEGLTEKEYKATKGFIDHETGHVLWPDCSYLINNAKDEAENEKEKLIWNIGNMIDDIRVERRLVNQFQIDEGNFTYLSELFYKDMHEITNLRYEDVDLLFFMVNIYYRKILRHKKIQLSSIVNEAFVNRLMPIIDRFIDSDEKAGETAKEIIDVWGCALEEQYLIELSNI